MKNLLPFLTFLILLAGCSEQNNHDNALFREVQLLLPHAPDSAFQYLKHNKGEIISRGDKASVELMEYYINDLKEYGFHKDSLVIKIRQNSPLYSSNYDQALAAYYKGVFRMTKYEYEKTIDFFHSAEQIANRMKWDPSSRTCYATYVHI